MSVESNVGFLILEQTRESWIVTLASDPICTGAGRTGNIDIPNGAASTNPAYTAPSSGRRFGGVVVPWSEYRQKLENERKILTGAPEEDPSQPVTIYLPPYKSNFASQKSSFTDFEYRRRPKVVEETRHGPSEESTQPPSSSGFRFPSSIARPGPTSLSYSTNSRKELIDQPNTSFSAISRPQTHSAMSLRHRDNLPSSSLQPQIPPSTPIVATTNQGPGFGIPRFSKLSPAPFNPLSSQGNLANSVLEQSQFRYAPQTPSFAGIGPNPPAPLTGNIFQPEASPFSENMLANLNPLQLLSTARDSPVEQIARIAKNLLSHENQQLFSSVANVLGGAKNSIGGLQGPEVGENLLGSGPPAIESELISSNNKDKENEKKEFSESEVIKSLNALPEEQRKLLQAAINNGELDVESLNGALSNSTESEEKKQNLIQTEHKLIEWIQQNRPATSVDETISSKQKINADKLPYYGKYCGSFVEQVNPKKNSGISGALWAVDNRRFIISKFHYQPTSISENVTFWLGPKKPTGNAVLDALPSENGVYLRPRPIDIQTFTVKEAQVINATIRHDNVSNDNTVAEAEKEEKKRKKRDLFSNVYENRIPFKISATFNNPKDTDTVPKSESIDVGINVVTEKPINETTTVPTTTSTTISSTTSTTISSTTPDPNRLVPLEWYAGFQPLLLTLPDDQEVKTTHWVSIYDHKRQSPISFVLIPNGNAFEIPSVVQLRPFAANGAYKISSGPIHILDTKTIEISDFSLETGGVPVWFMVGKEVLPNGNGHIVPVLNENSKKFDCLSLRNYKNETVTLKLPGAMDIKDVFWFSVFSIPQAISMANMYLPYNDMHLPPDLDGISTPICKWTPEK